MGFVWVTIIYKKSPVDVFERGVAQRDTVNVLQWNVLWGKVGSEHPKRVPWPFGCTVISVSCQHKFSPLPEKVSKWKAFSLHNSYRYSD